MTTSAVTRGHRIPIETLAPGDEVRISCKDLTVQEVIARSTHFVIRTRSGSLFRIPKGRKIRRQHS